VNFLDFWNGKPWYKKLYEEYYGKNLEPDPRSTFNQNRQFKPTPTPRTRSWRRFELSALHSLQHAVCILELALFAGVLWRGSVKWETDSFSVSTAFTAINFVFNRWLVGSLNDQARPTHRLHRSPKTYATNFKGVGDVGKGDVPPNFGKIFFGQMPRKIREFCYFLRKYHVKFGHLKKIIHIFSGKKILPLKLTKLLRLWPSCCHNFIKYWPIFLNYFIDTLSRK